MILSPDGVANNSHITPGALGCSGRPPRSPGGPAIEALHFCHLGALGQTPSIKPSGPVAESLCHRLRLEELTWGASPLIAKNGTSHRQYSECCEVTGHPCATQLWSWLSETQCSLPVRPPLASQTPAGKVQYRNHAAGAVHTDGFKGALL